MKPNAPRAARARSRDLRVVEFAGIGPGPRRARVAVGHGRRRGDDRPPGGHAPVIRATSRSGDAMVVQVDLATPPASQALQRCRRPTSLVEGFRPGVMERLGLGPEAVGRRNARLAYGRMTAGASMALAQAAGHDINYIALTVRCTPSATADRPVPPLNLLGTTSGQPLPVMASWAVLHEARRSGLGQVVDAAITDGVVNLDGAVHRANPSAVPSSNAAKATCRTADGRGNGVY